MEHGTRWVAVMALGASVADAQSPIARDAVAAPVAAAVATTSGDGLAVRRQQAVERFREELARCVMVDRCNAGDPFEELPRTTRPWTRLGTGNGAAAWGPSPFAGMIPSPASNTRAWSSAVAVAALAVLELDAQQLDRAPPRYDPRATPPARRQWALREVGPWLDAQAHALTVITTEMREARRVAAPDNAALWVVAERYARFVDQLEHVEAFLGPGDLAALDAARGGPLPPPAVMLAWAREGFAACLAVRSGHLAVRLRCEDGLREIDRTLAPSGAGSAPSLCPQGSPSP